MKVGVVACLFEIRRAPYFCGVSCGRFEGVFGLRNVLWWTAESFPNNSAAILRIPKMEGLFGLDVALTPSRTALYPKIVVR